MVSLMRLLAYNSVATITLEVKRSKFICFIMPISEFETQMQRLKLEHPKARHFVYAWRRLNEYSQIVEQSSDDGEPKGTSGRPTLAVLQGEDLIDTAIITVRYFGGIKLGTGGLVRAYGEAVNIVIDSVELKEYVKKVKLDVKVEYSRFEKFKHTLSGFDSEIIEQDFLTDCVNVTLEIDEALKEQFIEQSEPLFYT